MTISKTRIAAGFGRILAISALALGVTATTSTTASADFRGGGAMFAFTEVCQPFLGWGPQSVVEVQTRYLDTRIPRPNGQTPASSEVTLAMPSGALHFSLWQAPFTEDGPGVFRGSVGRGIFSQFTFMSPRPRMRVVSNRVVSRIDPNGPETLENARSVVLRLRIQNPYGVQGCAFTVSAVMVRI